MDDTNNYLIEANELICAGEYQKAEVKLNNVLTLLDKYYPFKYYCLIKLLQNKPQVVGFSVQAKSCFLLLFFAEIIKNINPNIYIILGGPETSPCPKALIETYKYMDAVFVCESDLSYGVGN
ncbi:MAG: hypothetical protein WCA84_20625 [Ignavibacteriaceae bacterium]|jgi:hypothetical protein